MNKKIMSIEVTKVGPGHLETMMSITGGPEDVSMAIAEMILKVNDCTNGTDIMKVKNGFWLLIQDIVNDQLAERSAK